MGQASSKQQQFYEACSYGREWIVEDLISQGIDVNWKSHIYDSCPIHVASQGKPKIVEMLIKANCDVDVRDASSNSALHHASMTGECASAELLIKAGASVNAYNERHWTPLINAAYWNHPQIIGLLLSKGANITWQNKEGRNALHELCRSKSSDTKSLQLSLELLLNEVRRLERIQLLCASNGKNLHCKWNPYNDQFKAKGFDVLEKKDTGILDDVPFIDLKSGTPHQNLDCEASFSPLLFASYHGHLGIVRTLISLNADIHAVDNNNWTSLHWAAQRGHLQIAQLLLDNGASKLCQDTHGDMPFQVTSSEIIRELLEPGISLNYMESNGYVTTDEEDACPSTDVSRSSTPNSRLDHRGSSPCPAKDENHSRRPRRESKVGSLLKSRRTHSIQNTYNKITKHFRL